MVFWWLWFPPKNERKQVDLRCHSSKVKFFRSFFGDSKNHFEIIWPLSPRFENTLVLFTSFNQVSVTSLHCEWLVETVALLVSKSAFFLSKVMVSVFHLLQLTLYIAYWYLFSMLQKVVNYMIDVFFLFFTANVYLLQ